MKVDAAMPQPAGAAPNATEAVDLSVIPSRNVALCGVKQQIRALVQIKTPPAPAGQPRPRLHVACVLDKSGSMSGAKLKMAKRAVRKLIKHLSPPDQLHFVTYDSNVQTVFENGDLTPNGKVGLVSKVKQVRAGTCTNLAGGLERGVGALNASAAMAATAGQPAPDVKRVFLFSDGNVNAGEQSHARILEAVDRYVAQGVTVSTFGIGADFDEKLMTGIAMRGRGDYAFLETPESIAPLVSKSVHSLLLLAGSQATLHVVGVNGAVLTKVYHEDEDEDERAAASASALLGDVAIGDLHAGNIKQILVELEVAPPGMMAADVPPAPQAVCEVTLVYTKPAPTAAAAAAAAVVVDVAERATAKATLTMSFTGNRNALGEENGDVAAAYMVQTAATLDNDVLDLVSRGEVEEAISMKERNLATMSTLVAHLEADPAYREGAARMLSRCVERQRGTVENMRRNKDSRTVSMGMRSEQRIQRRMSVCAYASGCDSDDGGYSDDDGEAFGMPPPPQRQGSLVTSSMPSSTPRMPGMPRRRYSSDGLPDSDSDSDGGDYGLGLGLAVTGGRAQQQQQLSCKQPPVHPRHSVQQPPPLRRRGSGSISPANGEARRRRTLPPPPYSPAKPPAPASRAAVAPASKSAMGKSKTSGLPGCFSNV